MKNPLLATVAGLLMALAITGAATAATNTNFGTVVDNLDLRKNTKLYVREYWKSIQDQQVSWSGEVYDVQGGAKSRVKLLVADKSRPIYKGYNIVVTSYDVEKAAKIKKGQRVRFTGTLKDYSAKRSGAVLEVSEATLQ